MVTIKKPIFNKNVISCFVLLLWTTVGSANRLLKETELEGAVDRAAARELAQAVDYGGSSGTSTSSSAGSQGYAGGVAISGGCGINYCGCGGGGVVIGGGCGINCGGGSGGQGCCSGGQGGYSGGSGGQGGYTGGQGSYSGGSGGQGSYGCGSGAAGQVGYVPCPIYVPVPVPVVSGSCCPQQPIGCGCGVVTPVPGYPGVGQHNPDKGKGMKKAVVEMAPEPMAVD